MITARGFTSGCFGKIDSLRSSDKIALKVKRPPVVRKVSDEVVIEMRTLHNSGQPPRKILPLFEHLGVTKNYLTSILQYQIRCNLIPR